MINYDTIKHTITIDQVLSKYGIHHPSRDSYSIPCPIHHGRDANFSVSEREGLWHCFSVCGRGGSVIDLVAALEGIDIKEAVKKLSTDYHLTPEYRSVAAAKTFTNQVKRYKKMKAENKIELPLGRPLEPGYKGLDKYTIDHWGLYRTDEGVLIPNLGKNGICSYTIRRDDGNPKYDNAAGMSKCYPFGLWQNKGNIITQGFAYIVEGQMDALMMWQYDYYNVIAIQGSQISEQQAMLILAVTSTLMLIMDGDEAGRKAAKEIKEKWGTVFKIGKIDLPDGVDPDEYLLKGGKLT